MRISENRLRTIIRGLVKESIISSRNRKLNEMYDEYSEQGDFEEMPMEDEYMEDEYMEDEYMPNDEYMEDEYTPNEEYIEDELDGSFDDMPGEFVTDPNFTY